MNTPNISYTIQHDVCTGCGICQGACPNDAIKFVVNNGEFKPVITRKGVIDVMMSVQGWG